MRLRANRALSGFRRSCGTTSASRGQDALPYAPPHPRTSSRRTRCLRGVPPEARSARRGRTQRFDGRPLYAWRGIGRTTYFEMRAANAAPLMVSTMQLPGEAGSQYPKMKYHWTKDPAIVNNADDGAALGGGWADTPAAFAPYSGPRPPRTADQKAIKWVDDWPVPAVMSDHRQGIKIELLRVDVAFWKSPDTPDAHHTAMRQAFEGVAMVLFAAGILTENLLRNEIPQLVWDSAIAAGWWRCASETPQNIFPERVGHYWVWRDDRTDWHRLFHDETEEWVVRLPVISKAGVAPNLGARLDAACDSAMISHQEQGARIGIGRSTYFEVKAGRGGKQARRRAEEYLRTLQTTPKPD